MLFRSNAAVARYEELKAEASRQAREMMRLLRAELRDIGRELSEAYAAWQKLLRSPELTA